MPYFLVTFMPENTKGCYFRGGVGYKAGTRWLFKDYVPPSITECSHMQIDEVSEEVAIELINNGIIYNDYLEDEIHRGSVGVVSTPTNINATNLDAQALEQMSKLIAQEVARAMGKIRQGNMDNADRSHYEESESHEELTLADIQAKIFKHNGVNLLAKNRKIGQLQERDDDDINKRVQLLRDAKGENVYTSQDGQNSDASDKSAENIEIAAEVVDNDGDIKQENRTLHDIMKDMHYAHNNDRKKKISEMLQRLKRDD